jgi:hypothetical protein
MYESERYELGEFTTWEAAVAASKQIVDEFLVSSYRPGMTAKELYEGYVGFGEDPFIISVTTTDDSRRFSAWSYAGSGVFSSANRGRLRRAVNRSLGQPP